MHFKQIVFILLLFILLLYLNTDNKKINDKIVGGEAEEEEILTEEARYEIIDNKTKIRIQTRPKHTDPPGSTPEVYESDFLTGNPTLTDFFNNNENVTVKKKDDPTITFTFKLKDWVDEEKPEQKYLIKDYISMTNDGGDTPREMNFLKFVINNTEINLFDAMDKKWWQVDNNELVKYELGEDEDDEDDDINLIENTPLKLTNNKTKIKFQKNSDKSSVESDEIDVSTLLNWFNGSELKFSDNNTYEGFMWKDNMFDSPDPNIVKIQMNAAKGPNMYINLQIQTSDGWINFIEKYWKIDGTNIIEMTEEDEDEDNEDNEDNDDNEDDGEEETQPQTNECEIETTLLDTLEGKLDNCDSYLNFVGGYLNDKLYSPIL